MNLAETFDLESLYQGWATFRRYNKKTGDTMEFRMHYQTWRQQGRPTQVVLSVVSA